MPTITFTNDTERVKVAKRFASKISPEGLTGCHLWTGSVNSSGYGRLFLYRRNGVNHYAEAHRTAWAIYCGLIPTGAHVLHHCDTPACCNPAHLYLGDNTANSADRVARGRTAKLKGEKNPRAKLTNEQVLAIFNDQRPFAEIAAAYEISEGPVGQIKSGKQWKHILGGAIAARVKHPAKLRGEQVAVGKLTEAQALAIFNDPRAQTVIAAEYGVSQVAVSCIKLGKTWKHIHARNSL